jgi:hypothetical protein
MTDNDSEIIKKLQEIEDYQGKIEIARLELMVLVKEASKINLDYITYNV